MSSLQQLRATARQPGHRRYGALLLAVALAATGVAGQRSGPDPLRDAARAALVDVASEAQPERRGDGSESAAGGVDNATPAALESAEQADDSPPHRLWLAFHDRCRDGHSGRIDRPPNRG